MIVAISNDRFRLGIFPENGLAHHYRGRTYSIVLHERLLCVAMGDKTTDAATVGRHSSTGNGFDFDLSSLELSDLLPTFAKHQIKAVEGDGDDFTITLPPDHCLPWPTGLRAKGGLADDGARVARDIQRRIEAKKIAGEMGALVVPAKIAAACENNSWRDLVARRYVVVQVDQKQMSPAQRARYQEAQRTCSLV